ncbi:MFS transporter [Paracoccus sp. PAMC 22219]|uniref:MFS transporter n=1 Tax=Paracoccus sp. PAMC 22219 TaxID=1569209 RepID=UPI000AF4CDB8|nr:MFS transporter [Paracoccus sp. PAMC 22219]
MATVSRSSMSDSTLLGLALLNFFLADARDGLGPFLDAFLATQGWSPLTLGAIATVGGLIGLTLTPFAGALVDRSRWKRALIAVPVVIVTAGALLTLLVPHPTVVWAGTIATAVLGVVIAPALAGLSLGLVGQRAFPRQISRNEFWNHSGNLASLMGIYLAVSLFGQFSVVWLMIITALGALIALLMISPDRIDHDVARGMVKDARPDDRARPSGLSVLLHNRGLVVLAIVMMLFHFGNAPMSRLIAQEFSIQLGTPFRTTALITGVA